MSRLVLRGDSDRTARIALSLRADIVAGQVLGAWREAGLTGVLLRGPVLAERLYDGDGERSYADCDLLVAGHERERAEAMLARMGFAHHPLDAGHSRHWCRNDGAEIDLHRSLEGVKAPPSVVWEGFSAHTAALKLAGWEVSGLDDVAIALVVCLHAAQHGRLLPHPLEDLRRALLRLDDRTWVAARALAADLDALDAFGDGLGVLPEAVPLRRALGVDGSVSVWTRLRAEGREAPTMQALGAVSRASGPGTKLAIAARLAAPSPWFMREHDPWAARGRLGLFAAYLRRPLRVGPRVIADWLTVRRAR